MGISAFFHGKQQILWQMANSVAWHENLHVAEYCCPCLYACELENL